MTIPGYVHHRSPVKKIQPVKQIKLTGWDDENEQNCIQTTPILTGYIIIFGSSRGMQLLGGFLISLSRPSASHPLVVKPLCLDK